MVNRSGTVIGLKVRLPGMVRVVRTTPGSIDPQGEPMPGKAEAAPQLPLLPPVAAPMRLTKGGEMLPPESPRFGPTPPTNGNCTNGWLKAGRKTVALAPTVGPLTLSGAMMMAAPLPRLAVP